MTTTEAGAVLKLAMVGTVLPGIPFVNTFWFRQVAAIDLDEEALAADFTSNMQTLWKPAVSTTVVWGQTEVQLYIPFFSPLVIYTAAPLPVTGTAGTGITGGGYQACMLAQHAIMRTAIAGRQFRGRLYLPQSDAPEQADGARWGSAQVGRVQAFLNGVLNRYHFLATDAKWEWGVWSRVRGGNLGAGGRYVNTPPFHDAGFEPITSVTAYAGIRTQRRREAPRGT